MLAVPFACTPAGEGENAEALRTAVEELAAARAAFEADRAATSTALAELRKALDETNATLDALTAERGRPVRPSLGRSAIPVPGPVEPALGLTPGPMPRPEPVDPAMSLDPALGSPLGEDSLAGKVRCDVDGKCKILRASFEELFTSPSAFVRQARIVPSQLDGVIQGYKLYGIRRASLPKALGFKNGDLVRSIDGKPLGSMDEVMKLFTELRKASKYELVVERKGVPLTLTLELVERLDP